MAPAVTAHLDAILGVFPPEWSGTDHGRRAEQRVLDFLVWAVKHRYQPPPPYRAVFASGIFTGELVTLWLDHLGRDKGYSPATRNRAVAAVLRVWRRAHRRGLLDAPPSGLYEREPRGRRRVLSAAEERDVLANLAAPYRTLSAFLLLTGLRVSEALELRWDDLTWGDAGVRLTAVRVRDSKNGDARTVPIAVPWSIDNHRDPLSKPGCDGGPFQSISQSAFNHAWAAARAAMGLESDTEFVPHMLRHTYATRLVVAGVPLSVVARLLGHRSVRTTMRYSHVSDADAASWVRRVSGQS